MASLSPTHSHFELEAMLKEDFSWHPCQVSLSSVEDGLSLDFGSQELGILLLNKEEVSTRLRFRSLPLKDDDCLSIKEGDHVLATNKSRPGSDFYDAKVAKVLRVRHCRGPCRCMFTIKWLHQDSDSGIIVPSSSIMKSTTKKISDYPMVAMLLGSAKDVKSSDPSLYMIEDMNYDLTKLLEEQIKDISNSAGAIKKETPSETRVKIEAKLIIPRLKVPNDQTPLKRITRNSSNIQMNSSIQQELPECKSPLSPLAACAALASRMQIDPNYATIDGTSELNPFMSNNMLMKNKLLTDESTTPFPAVLESVKMGRTLHSVQRDDASWNLHMELSSGKRKHKDETSRFTNSSAEDRTLHFISSSTHATCTRRKLELNRPTKATRLKGSAIQNDGETSNDNIDKNFADDLKLGSSTSGKRLTRSTSRRKQENIELKAKSSPVTIPDSCVQNLPVSQSNGSGISTHNVQRRGSADDMKIKASTNSRRFTRSALQKDRENLIIDSKDNSSPITPSDSGKNCTINESSVTLTCTDAEIKMSAYDIKSRASATTKRFTRSALQQEKKFLAVELDYKLPYETELNYPEGQANISKKSSCRVKRKKTDLVLDAKIDNLTIKGSNDKKGASVQASQPTEGRSPGNNKNVKGQKKKCISSNTQLRRLSLRNFLPRTRSQLKSA